MSIFISGDTHGDFRRFSSQYFLEGKNLNRNDYVIINNRKMKIGIIDDSKYRITNLICNSIKMEWRVIKLLSILLFQVVDLQYINLLGAYKEF